MAIPFEVILFLFMLATALSVMYLTDLFAAAMVTGVFSLLSAGLFTLMDAVDVAFTEAAVGAGISTVLILGTLALTTDKEDQQAFRWGPAIVVTVLGAILIVGTLDMPHYGDPAAVIHNYLVPRYIEGATTEFGIPNIVTVVLASYRGFDTLGETVVVLTAAVGVMLLLGSLRRRDPDDRTSTVERLTMTPDSAPSLMMEHTILRVATMFLTPLILLFALYVQFHGDFGPGGGFQAGVIFAAGLILHGIIFGLTSVQGVAPPRVMRVGLAVGVLLYAGTGVASLLLGGNYLDYAVLDSHDPIHGRHLGILLVEGGVGITVTCAMTLIFYNVAGRRFARSGEKDQASK